MHSITLYPNKFSYKDDDENFQNRSLYEIDKHLWCPVDVHESVTIKTLLEILNIPSFSFWKDALTEPLLPHLYTYYKKNLKDHKKKSPFDNIVFHWGAEFWDWKDEEKNFEEEISIGLDCSGFVENDPENESGIYGLTFTSLKELVNAPIRVDKKFEIFLYGDKKGPKNEKISFGLRTPTLLELMKAFVYEATFIGTEEDKVEQFQELQQTIEDIKSGKEKTYKFKSIQEMNEFLDNISEEDEDNEE